MEARSTLLLTLLFLFASSLSTVSLSDRSKVRIPTPSISITLSDATGMSVSFGDLVEWGGAMGANHHYFGLGNVDVFTGTAKCLQGRPCKINLTSDGTGPDPRWQCRYVKVAMFDPYTGFYGQDYPVNKWLQPPKLSWTKDLCGMKKAGENTFGPRQASPQIMSRIV